MTIKQSRYITVDTTVKRDMAIRTTELDKVKDDPCVRKSEVQQIVNNSTLPVSSRAVKSAINSIELPSLDGYATEDYVDSMVDLVDEKAAEAKASADRAEQASLGASLNANVFSSIEEGLSSVDVGEQFQVLSDDGFQYIRYEKESASKSKEVARFSSGKDPLPKMRYHGKNYPLKPMVREGIESRPHSFFNRAILGVEVYAPYELVSTKFFSITYFQNGASLSGLRHNGIRVEMYDRDTYEDSGAGISIHAPQDYPAEYDRELGGIQTFDLVCAHDERVKLRITLDVDSLPVNGATMRKSVKGDDAWSWIIDPSCYVSSDIKPVKIADNSISGALAIGASLINSVNGWFESACEKLDIIGINKAVGGQMPQYHADKIYRGTFCTDQEFEDADILVIQYASSKELDDETGLLQYSDDYTADFDINNASNQFIGKYSQAQIVDYIIKYWRERCFAQKDNADSKWYGTKFGKPFRVVFVTHWHDSRDYYNIPIRNLAKKWGGVVCAFDEKIGFTKNTPMPDGTQVSLLYAMDSQTIDGILYGWHPSRGQEGEYIQKTMSNIFTETIAKNYL